VRESRSSGGVETYARLARYLSRTEPPHFLPGRRRSVTCGCLDSTVTVNVPIFYYFSVAPGFLTGFAPIQSQTAYLFLQQLLFFFYNPRSRSKDWHLRILFLFNGRLCSLTQLRSFLSHPTPTFLPSESIYSSAMLRNRPTRKGIRALGQARAWTTPLTATLAQSKLPATQRTKATATTSAAP
jgi:hypothetical protein